MLIWLFAWEFGSGACHMNFSINPVLTDDLPLLLELIRELAQFEKLEDQLEATVESLRDALCSARPIAGAFLARCGEDPAGYAIFYWTFSSFLGRRGVWLEDVYVRPAFRRNGLGRSLITAVANIAAEQNSGRLEWTA